MLTEYEPVIGLEIHAQLQTKSKMFCGCSADYADAPPNTHVCPVCMGAPGVMPVINGAAIADTVKVALALHCTIPPHSKFDRKNYAYPDLVKGYQISQYDMPLSENGYVLIEADGQEKQVGIVRVHLEEDTAKLVHRPDGRDSYSLMDINRSGVPLMEIVSEPDITSPDDARIYFQTLRSVLQYLDVNDGDMDKGSLRCDANISMRPKGTTGLGTKTEIKNMNSFRSVRDALEYEVVRQTGILQAGDVIVQETRGWDDAKGVTVSQRTKEAAHDYRYFPEPDLPPLHLSEAYIEEIRRSLPELAQQRRTRFQEQFGLPEGDAHVLSATKKLADFFEKTLELSEPGASRDVANRLLSDVGGLLNSSGQELEKTKLTPGNLAAVVRLSRDGTLNSKTAKVVLEETLMTGEDPVQIVTAKGLAKISDPAQLQPIIDAIIAGNVKAVADYQAGKGAAVEALFGQVMGRTRGQADPVVARDLLIRAITL